MDALASRTSDRPTKDRISRTSLTSEPDVRLLPMRSWRNLNGNAILQGYHTAQHVHPIRDVWSAHLRLPLKVVEYICAVTADFEAQIRQESILLLKRYIWAGGTKKQKSRGEKIPLQVVALICAHLAIKHWQRHGIPEQKLHWLSRNAYTREDFINAELDVLRTLGCCLYWEGALLAEWQALVLYLAAPLLAEEKDVSTIGGVVAHISDVLHFHDDLMASHLPSELAAATIHAAAIICTRTFTRFSFNLRVLHLCGASEDVVLQLSEKILTVAIGSRCTEILLEGSGVTSEGSFLGTVTKRRRSRSPSSCAYERRKRSRSRA